MTVRRSCEFVRVRAHSCAACCAYGEATCTCKKEQGVGASHELRSRGCAPLDRTVSEAQGSLCGPACPVIPSHPKVVEAAAHLQPDTANLPPAGGCFHACAFTPVRPCSSTRTAAPAPSACAAADTAFWSCIRHDTPRRPDCELRNRQALQRRHSKFGVPSIRGHAAVRVRGHHADGRLQLAVVLADQPADARVAQGRG